MVDIDISGSEIIDCRKLFRRIAKEKKNEKAELLPPGEYGNGTLPDSSSLPPKVKKPDLFMSSAGENALTGLSGLESVVASLERRFAAGNEFESESESERDSESDSHDEHQQEKENQKSAKVNGTSLKEGNGKNRKRKRAKGKISKEEREWLNEGEGFLDDVEVFGDLKRKAHDKESKLKFDGFFVYRGPLNTNKKDVTPHQNRNKKKANTKGKDKANNKSEESEEESEEEDDDIDFVSSFKQQLKRVKEVLESLENPKDILEGKFPGVLDVALINLEKAVKKSVNKYTKNKGYRSLLQEILPIEEEKIDLNMRRIRLLSNVQFHRSSYIKSIGTLRKWVKGRIEFQKDKDGKKINLEDWSVLFDSLWKSNGKIKKAEIIQSKLEKQYKQAYVESDTKSTKKLAQVEKKAQKLQEAIMEEEDKTNKELIAMVVGLILRKKTNVKFTWNKEGKKLLKSIGLFHRKWSISVSKLREAEKLTLGNEIEEEKLTSGKSRKSMKNQIRSMWPSQAMKPEEIHALTSDSLKNLPKDSRIMSVKKDATTKSKSKSPSKQKKDTKSPSKVKKEAEKKSPEKKKNQSKSPSKQTAKGDDKESAMKAILKRKSSKTSTDVKEETERVKKKTNKSKGKGQKESFLASSSGENSIGNSSSDDDFKEKGKSIVKILHPQKSVTFDSQPKWTKKDFPFPVQKKKRKN